MRTIKILLLPIKYCNYELCNMLQGNGHNSVNIHATELVKCSKDCQGPELSFEPDQKIIPWLLTELQTYP